jgi:nucleoside-diphosphate-sugar epimerase
VILITGGLAMIGAHTARALLDLGEEVVVTKHRRGEVPSFLVDQVTVERLDVTDRDVFLAFGERHDITGIVHLAAAGLAVEDPVEFLRINTTGLLNALDAARTWGVRRLAVASSIGVYLGRPERRWHEDLHLPATTYDNPIPAFKKAAETLTTQGLAGSGVQPVVVRIGTIWGPLGDPASPFYPVPSLINAMVRGDEPPAAYADDGGDRCYALDAGRAIALLMTTSTLRHDTYNVSSGRPVANREFAAALETAVPGAQVDLLPGREVGGPDDPYLDITRLTADTAFAPAFDVTTGVADYVAWLADNPR